MVISNFNNKPAGKAGVAFYDEICTKEELTYNSQHDKVEGLEEHAEDTMGQYVSNHTGEMIYSVK